MRNLSLAFVLFVAAALQTLAVEHTSIEFEQYQQRQGAQAWSISLEEAARYFDVDANERDLNEVMMSSGSGSGSGGGGGGKYRAPRPPLDVEGYPVAPSELELEQVHVFVRHGERTPVSVRMADPPGSVPAHWIMCTQARRFRAAVAGSVRLEAWGVREEVKIEGVGMNMGELDVRRVVERADGVAAVGECLLGELTDVGRKTTYDFGRALRRLYVDSLLTILVVIDFGLLLYLLRVKAGLSSGHPERGEQRLLPLDQPAADDRIFTADCAWLVSDGQVRCRCATGAHPEWHGRESAWQYAVVRAPRKVAPQILQRQVSLKSTTLSAASTYNHTLEPLDKKISKYLGGNPIRIDGRPRASGVLDTIRAAMAHGIKVPPEFEEKAVMEPIEKAVVNEWFAGYKMEEVRRLGMGRLLSDMTQKFELKAREGTGTQRTPKILVHSTHDSALAGLANTLDVFDDRWPAFTASITFELFRRKDGPESTLMSDGPTMTTATYSNQDRTFCQSPPNPGILQTVLGSSPFRRRTKPPASSEHYVRARYQNRNLLLPLCAEEGKHLPGSPEFCTLEAFAERVRELTPVEWEAECAIGTRINPEEYLFDKVI
ncbi:hypothetical protein EW146_g8034 [Bondarzewia mesenterica]|uniref:Phosphoglycerate mutase-like protein n=1 Tax=Bondarzewia mesenterica TaxID=1095465 RepID=A0A4S4LI54_9AGAM|nr:hypothetical protein EW146_g8034 [Bondarzewia mesenterica]